MNIAVEIEKLLILAQEKNILDKMDLIGARNNLLDLLQVAQPCDGPVSLDDTDTIPAVLDRMVDYAGQQGQIDSSIFELRALFDTRIMGLLMPSPSVIASSFNRIREQSSIEAATDYFYNLSIDSNYIRMAQIRQNKSWLGATEYGDLEITINLSKPEKDPKAIAMARNQQDVHYPRCLLCVENVNYAGRIDFPARQTLRLIPLQLNGDNWYLQYSPYVYYNEHCIVLSERHEPMVINRQTFQAILGFVSQFPHYFCGSNADLPIVGGSILNHNHFQGGRAAFPMDTAPVLQTFRHQDYPDVRVDYLYWPLTSLRLTSTSPESLVDLADHLLGQWRRYSDPAVEIQAESIHEGQLVPHNTITPIARQNAQGEFQLDLVLRNNRTTEDLPLGIFHPHPEIHHIKKENIGLIEVMGLAILPGRLQTELAEIRDILLGRVAFETIDQPGHTLLKHLDWIQAMQQSAVAQQAVAEVLSHKTAGTREQPDALDRFLQDEISRKFKTGLEHCGVFKHNELGNKALGRFMISAGFTVQNQQ